MINQGSRQALYLQDCQIPQNKFLRDRATVGEREGEERVFSCHGDTEVSPRKALPATCVQSSLPSRSIRLPDFQVTFSKAQESRLR